MTEKLIWKGTTKEAIELGKLTQEEIDEWDIQDKLKDYERELREELAEEKLTK